MLMKFKDGDRVHVTSWNESDVDFYATLRDGVASKLYLMIDTSNPDYEGYTILKPDHYHFGEQKRDYYTLATDEEDTEKPEIQYITDTSDYELKIGDWIQYVAVNGEDRFGKVIGFQRSMDEQQIYMNLSLMNGNTDSIPKKRDWVKTRPNEAFLLDGAYNKRNKNPNDLQQRKRNYTLSTDEAGTDKPEIQYICDMYNAPCNRLKRRTNNVELDDEYIIEVKKGLYVREVTSNYYFRFTKNIKESKIYEDKSDAIEHAELIGGRVLNLKRYVEVG